jgi:exopolysaccharide biosynthesis polyprenyl glycosylphosphotransferase
VPGRPQHTLYDDTTHAVEENPMNRPANRIEQYLTQNRATHLRSVHARHPVVVLLRYVFSSESVYMRAKIFAPLVAVTSGWLLLVPHPGGLEGIANTSLSVRHLLVFSLFAFLSGVLARTQTRGAGVRRQLRRELVSVCVSTAALGLTLDLVRAGYPDFYHAIRIWQACGLLLATYGFLVLLVGIQYAVSVSPVTRRRVALVVGSGARGRALTRALRAGSRYSVLGCIDDSYMGPEEERAEYLGAIDALGALLKEKPIEVVLIALPVRSMYGVIQEVIGVCESIGVDCKYMSDLFETTLAQRTQEAHSSHPHLTVLSAARLGLHQLLKRAFDITVAGVLLLLTLPLLAAIAIAVRLTSPGGVIFQQERYGLHRRRFRILKFRTMVSDAEALQASIESLNEAQGPVFKIKRDPRITPIGRFLRKTSLDELPQLINVLRGEMSLVGPRPLPLRDVQRFEESRLLRRFSVKPGLTCLWQVGGRSDTSFADWMRLDLEYIDDWSLMLDAKILLRTVPAVLRGSGAS